MLRASTFNEQLTEFWAENGWDYPDCAGEEECKIPPVVVGRYKRAGKVLVRAPLCFACAGFPQNPTWLEVER